MSIDAETMEQVERRFEVLLPHLNERQKRLALGDRGQAAGARWSERGGRGARVSPTTVRTGVTELEAGEDPLPVAGPAVLVADGNEPACMTLIFVAANHPRPMAGRPVA